MANQVVLMIGVVQLLFGLWGAWSSVVRASSVLPVVTSAPVFWLSLPGFSWLTTVVVSVVSLAAAIGLFWHKAWARIVIMVLAAYGLFMVLVVSAQILRPGYLGSAVDQVGVVQIMLSILLFEVVPLAWNGFVIYYLIRPSAKTLFV